MVWPAHDRYFENSVKPFLKLALVQELATRSEERCCEANGTKEGDVIDIIGIKDMEGATVVVSENKPINVEMDVCVEKESIDPTCNFGKWYEVTTAANTHLKIVQFWTPSKIEETMKIIEDIKENI